MKKDFDEAILDNEVEFKKRFRRIERPAFLGQPKAVKESKSRITIYLDADIVEHFKGQAENSNIGYQTLINQTLREKINNPQSNINPDDLLEKLLRDKDALSRLKAELETV